MPVTDLRRDDTLPTRTSVLDAVARDWLRAHPDVLVTAHNLGLSLGHLLTLLLGSGPAARRTALPARAAVLLTQAGVDRPTAQVCRSFAKGDALAPDHAAAFAAMAVALAPVAAAIQLSRTPCQSRTIELARELGQYREAGRADAPITQTMVKDRTVSVLTPLAADEYVAQPGRDVGTYLRLMLDRHVATAGTRVLEILVAATQRRLPRRSERETVARFEELWGSSSRDSLLRHAERICPGFGEDVVQDTAERVLKWVVDNPTKQPPAPAAFLHRVVINAALTRLRRAATVHDVPLDPGHDGSADRPDLDWVVELETLTAAAASAIGALTNASKSGDGEATLAAAALQRRFLTPTQPGQRPEERHEAWHDLAQRDLLRDLGAEVAADCVSKAQAQRVARRALTELARQLGR